MESAVTDHKLKRVVAIKPTQDCISPIIKHPWIIQGDIYHLWRRPWFYFLFFFIGWGWVRMGAVLGFLTHPCITESGLPDSQGPGWLFAGIWVVSCLPWATLSTRCWLGKLWQYCVLLYSRWWPGSEMLESLEGNLFREPDPVLSEDVGRAPTDCNDCGAEPGALTPAGLRLWAAGRCHHCRLCCVIW